MTQQVGQSAQVISLGRGGCLELPHGASRRRAALYCLTTNQLAHTRITADPVGIVDVLITGETRKTDCRSGPTNVCRSSLLVM